MLVVAAPTAAHLSALAYLRTLVHIASACVRPAFELALLDYYEIV